MNSYDVIWKSLLSLYSWVKKEKYYGWDPYDWYLSPLSSKIPKIVNFVLIQFNLYSPINFRSLFGIKKGISNKALALFSQAYLTLNFRYPEFKAEGKRTLLILERNKIKTDYGYGWASHYFKFFGPKHMLTPDVPDIVGTSEAIKAFSLAYKLYKNKNYAKISKNALNSLLNEYLSSFNGNTYFKYTPNEKGKIVFNVSALALSAISCFLRNCELNKDAIVTGNKVVKFLLNFQRKDGSWPYSYYPSTRKFYTQLDYHQGFIIDGLVEFLPYIQDKNLKKEVEKKIIMGVEFYMRKQFTEKGVSYYRYPIKYPVDIHNQAQGIITFSKLYKAFDNPKYLNFSLKIAEWTIRNMQDPKGYFYAHKWPFFTNKIPYMRWGQAWMMLALATLLEVLIDENSNDRAD